MALPIVEVQTLCPNSSSKAWRCSSRVRSSLASRCLGSHSLSITPFLEGLPGIGSGSTSPVSRRLLSQRFMEGIETEKVFATCSLGLPESTAESTLNLRSFEYGFMPEGYHIWIDTYGCRCKIHKKKTSFTPVGLVATERREVFASVQAPKKPAHEVNYENVQVRSRNATRRRMRSSAPPPRTTPRSS